jgi:diguanylate cyclase (GGDEF)-like protein
MKFLNINSENDKLSIYLSLLSVLIAFIPMTVLYIAIAREATSTLSEVLSKELEVKSFLIKRDIERFYLQRMTDIKNLSQADVLETDNLSAIDQYIQEITTNSPYDVELVSLNGTILSNSSDKLIKKASVFDVYPSSTNLFQQAFKGKQGEVLISPLTKLNSGVLGVILITPVTDDSNEEVIKLLLVEISLSPIIDLLDDINSTEQANDREVFLINSTGLVVASTNLNLQQLTSHPYFSDNVDLLKDVLSEKHLTGSRLFERPNNEKIILGFSNLSYGDISENLNWSVVVTASYDKILAPANNLATNLFWVLILTAIVIFAVMYLSSRKVMSFIWRKANFDSITGLPNRRLFVDRLLQSIQLSQRNNFSSALLYIDLDRFKEINDSLGHDVGDKLLIETAHRLSLLVRENDSVSRIGGDEFSIIINALKDCRVDNLAVSIITALNKPFNIENNVLFISASIGIAIYPQDGKDFSSLLKSADQALYKSKHDGRNRFTFFTPTMQKRADKRYRISNDLRTAISHNEFELYYQPIINPKSTEILKAEALIRWNHPELGFIPPLEFISIAEETNFIATLGDWVFSEALNMISDVKAKYNIDLNISINLSPMQFKAKDLLTNWLEQLHEKGLSGANITIEITESIFMVNDASINKQLIEFRKAGIYIALDDFGTGYSSLSYLRRFPIDILKIDKSFVDDIEQNSDDLALCQAIVVMSNILGIKVVAEGVETKEQSNFLVDIGVDYCQGYFFSRPLAYDAFINYLLGKKN